MPARSDRPGLQRRGGALYWVAPKKARQLGFEPRTVRLHFAEDDPALADRCVDLQQQVAAWLAGQIEERRSIPFLGTIASLIRVYQTDPESPFHSLEESTQESYRGGQRLIERTVGARMLYALDGRDFRRWHKGWAAEGAHITRAYNAVTQLRVLLSFGIICGFRDCKRLKDILSEMRFENPSPREEFITLDQAVAFIAKAHEMGEPALALAQALQFEAMLRQSDVIGQWSAAGRWKGLLWNHIRDGVLDMKTSKTGARAVVDLREYPLAKAELDRVPSERRIGPVILDPRTGEPFKKRSFSRRWREVARAAGIPDHVWNRDSRAGGVTEGGDAGASIDDLQQHASHANRQTTARYNRKTLEKTTRVARLRVQRREGR
jgi:integrase